MKLRYIGLINSLTLLSVYKFHSNKIKYGIIFMSNLWILTLKRKHD